ncbi:MAG: hypothetical protein HY904_05970 [Deltaproteobacteria bacterium]|nr:hypothetical protein [Deltaproteobacteria bacterium]
MSPGTAVADAVEAARALVASLEEEKVRGRACLQLASQLKGPALLEMALWREQELGALQAGAAGLARRLEALSRPYPAELQDALERVRARSAELADINRNAVTWLRQAHAIVSSWRAALAGPAVAYGRSGAGAAALPATLAVRG